MTNDSNSSNEINVRLAIARQVMRQLTEIWKSAEKLKKQLVKSLAVADSGGGPGGPAPPFGKVKTQKRAPLTENDVLRSRKREILRYYPPPTESAFGDNGKFLLLPSPPLNRTGFLRSRKISATTPPPPLNRVDTALHTKAGPLLRKILDLRLVGVEHSVIWI